MNMQDSIRLSSSLEVKDITKIIQLTDTPIFLFYLKYEQVEIDNNQREQYYACHHSLSPFFCFIKDPLPRYMLEKVEVKFYVSCKPIKIKLHNLAKNNKKFKLHIILGLGQTM